MYTSVCNADIRTGAANENCSGGIYDSGCSSSGNGVLFGKKKKKRSPMNICSDTKIKYINFHLSHIKSGMLVYPRKSCEL